MRGLLRRQSPDRIARIASRSCHPARSCLGHTRRTRMCACHRLDLRSHQVATVILEAIRLAIFVGQARKPERIVVPESHHTISRVSTSKQLSTRIDLIPRAALIRIDNLNETPGQVIPERLTSTIRRPDPRDPPHRIRFVHGRLPGRIGHTRERSTCVIRKPRNLAGTIGIRRQLRTTIPLMNLYPPRASRIVCTRARPGDTRLQNPPDRVSTSDCRDRRNGISTGNSPDRFPQQAGRSTHSTRSAQPGQAHRCAASTPALVIFEARRVPGRIGRADQLPLCVPLQLPHVAFGIRMARRLLILVPRPARHATDLVGNRHRSLREIRVERVCFAVVGPVAHHTRVAADTLPRIKHCRPPGGVCWTISPCSYAKRRPI